MPFEAVFPRSLRSKLCVPGSECGCRVQCSADRSIQIQCAAGDPVGCLYTMEPFRGSSSGIAIDSSIAKKIDPLKLCTRWKTSAKAVHHF
jgi:hypothetical protein